MSTQRLVASFRDPAGFLFRKDGILCRQVNRYYRQDYKLLIQSGLYDCLVRAGWLISHEETREEGFCEEAYKVIRPKELSLISYPYEWSFSQLKDAALLTLQVQKTALNYGMSLKDSSAYNIQFDFGKPVFIDTLSFERYEEGEPWVAYRQFCQHFLAPLLLMSYTDIRLSQLLRIYMDGIPLDLTSRLLPLRTKWKFSFVAHIHLHARMQSHFAKKKKIRSQGKMSKHAVLGLVDNLETAVKKIVLKPQGTEWGDYYKDTNYTKSGMDHKLRLVTRFVEQIKPAVVWDFGSNVGRFSRITGGMGIPTIAFDIDPTAVERLYLECRDRKEKRVMPLVLDLCNPSPALGWCCEERNSLLDRCPADLVLALALIHHLAIGNNVPLHMLADFFSKICRSLVIEFVPKVDSQVQRLLVKRKDIFANYTLDIFEREFSKRFDILSSKVIKDSKRMIYYMRNRNVGLQACRPL